MTPLFLLSQTVKISSLRNQIYACHPIRLYDVPKQQKYTKVVNARFCHNNTSKLRTHIGVTRAAAAGKHWAGQLGKEHHAMMSSVTIALLLSD